MSFILNFNIMSLNCNSFHRSYFEVTIMDNIIILYMNNCHQVKSQLIIIINNNNKAMQTKFIVSQARPHDKIASRLLFFYHVMARDHRIFMVDSCIFQCCQHK